ncbi:MAG TPA: hypothetical protein VFE47_05355 [Tepidisphaeraceae bacterium]|jgi:hypothetical protein|nr:hypothetical protein [Tepidisphaeraceae bacterium]
MKIMQKTEVGNESINAGIARIGVKAGIFTAASAMGTQRAQLMIASFPPSVGLPRNREGCGWLIAEECN